MSAVPQALDLLALPLHGLRLIEASAGTGKTFALAVLYLRLVLERGLFPPQILVMTFTEAATAELRERIRARLTQAAQYFRRADSAVADPVLRDLADRLGPAQWPTCAARLDVAAQWMDEAAIHTIHGWCSRMLTTHAFDSASLFRQSRVEDSDRLRLQAVQDYWRRWFYPWPVDALAALDAIGGTPQELLKKVKPLLERMERSPEACVSVGECPELLVKRWQRWDQTHQRLQAAARRGWTPPLVLALRDAWTNKRLKGVQARHLSDWLTQMQRWAEGAEADDRLLSRFTVQALVAKGWAQAVDWAALDDLQCLCDHRQAEPQLVDDLLAHAAQAVWQAVQHAKTQSAQFDFSDLLQNLYHALHVPGHRLAQVLAAQYPVALVDEFQDTDPWQFGILHKIYSISPSIEDGQSDILHENSTAVQNLCLVLIGDPKQAIYSFRGADLDTYRKARGLAQGIYTLAYNYRSTDGVVAAVNTIFGQAEAPFGELSYVPVQARNLQIQALEVAGVKQAAATVWHLADGPVQNKQRFLTDMAARCASQMVLLLQSGAVCGGDMAVLVRDWTEAAAMRQALAERNVPSVYKSERGSVYASTQATDLWRILRAVANPASNRLLRAALATRTWALGWDALAQLLADEAGWDAQVEQFMQWQRVWRTRGFLPMLYRLLHDQGLPARLLADERQGARALTNLLHLGELLQVQAAQVQGEGALLRYLEDQLRRPGLSSDAVQLRLESDADLVQVVTMHKAKGLEYPLVFLPFVSLFRTESDDSARTDEQRLQEDIRLLYVALTRAQRALWLGVAEVNGDLSGEAPVVRGALSALLGRKMPDDLSRRLQTWANPHIVIKAAPVADRSRFVPTTTPQALKPVRMPTRLHPGGWWSASFSALTRDLGVASAISERDQRWHDAQLDNATVVMTTDTSASVMAKASGGLQDFPAGAAYGTLLHDLLQWQAEHGWPIIAHEDRSLAPATQGVALADTNSAWNALLQQQTQRLGLTEPQVHLLLGWVARIVRSKLPLAVVDNDQIALTLGALDVPEMWPEMGFTLTVQGLPSDRLDSLIARHLWPQMPRPPLQPRSLQGLLTGFMDLVLQHRGRYYVLDYKSNRLADYQALDLQQAMLTHRYDVQATLYLLALHRLLRSRLPDYDYDRHVGGALYVFLRGIDHPGRGAVPLRPPRSLIEELDAAVQAPLTHGGAR